METLERIRGIVLHGPVLSCPLLKFLRTGTGTGPYNRQFLRTGPRTAVLQGLDWDCSPWTAKDQSRLVSVLDQTGLV